MIQIQQPEIEALIHKRLVDGGFADIEAVLKQALEDAPLPSKAASPTPEGPSGLDIVAAFQRCPVKDFNFEPVPFFPPISDPIKF